MQVTLNQQDIMTAVKVYLDKIMAVPVDVVNLDIKGMRTTEGYTATVDVVLEGQSYVPIRPAVDMISVAESDVQPVKRHFDGLPKLTSEESALVVEILELIANNPRSVNDIVIKSKADSASANVITTLEANSAYIAVLERLNALASVEKESVTEIKETVKPNFESAPEPNDEGEANAEELPAVAEVISESTKHKVKTGVNFLGEPIYEELTLAEIQERGISMNDVQSVVNSSEVKKGMFD